MWGFGIHNHTLRFVIPDLIGDLPCITLYPLNNWYGEIPNQVGDDEEGWLRMTREAKIQRQTPHSKFVYKLGMWGLCMTKLDYIRHKIYN